MSQISFTLALQIKVDLAHGKSPEAVAATYGQRFPGATDLINALIEEHVAASDGHRKFGEFELLRELGGGSQGRVYEARSDKYAATVALKVLNRGLEIDQDRLEREFELQSASHSIDGLARALDHGSVDDQAYLVMELAPGDSLANRVREDVGRPVDAKELALRLRAMVRVCETLHDCHESGIVHRDVKPGNIVFDEESGRTTLVDLGIASAPPTGATLTRDEDLLGTIGYMAPEALEGVAGRDRRLDVYGVGVTLFALATNGELPFQASGVADMTMEKKAGRVRSLRSLTPHAPADLEAVVLECLAPEPDRRYSTVMDLARDLERVVAGEPVTARPPTLGLRAQRFCRNEPKLALSIAGLVILTLVSVALWIESEFQRGRANRGHQAAMTASEELVFSLYYEARDAGVAASIRRPLIDSVRQMLGAMSREEAPVQFDRLSTFLHVFEAEEARMRGQSVRALEHLQTALGLSELLLSRVPGAPEYQRDRIVILKDLANVEWYRGERKAARRHLEAALTHGEALWGRRSDLRSRVGLARLKHDYADVLIWFSPAAALNQFEDALTLVPREYFGDLSTEQKRAVARIALGQAKAAAQESQVKSLKQALIVVDEFLPDLIQLLPVAKSAHLRTYAELYRSKLAVLEALPEEARRHAGAASDILASLPPAAGSTDDLYVRSVVWHQVLKTVEMVGSAEEVEVAERAFLAATRQLTEHSTGDSPGWRYLALGLRDAGERRAGLGFGDAVAAFEESLRASDRAYRGSAPHDEDKDLAFNCAHRLAGIQLGRGQALASIVDTVDEWLPDEASSHLRGVAVVAVYSHSLDPFREADDGPLLRQVEALRLAADEGDSVAIMRFVNAKVVAIARRYLRASVVASGVAPDDQLDAVRADLAGLSGFVREAEASGRLASEQGTMVHNKLANLAGAFNVPKLVEYHVEALLQAVAAVDARAPTAVTRTDVVAAWLNAAGYAANVGEFELARRRLDHFEVLRAQFATTHPKAHADLAADFDKERADLVARLANPR
ncbi:MAG: serine/threonine protein kinase [bacterium]|nr:serine/threonine protein kinase [bacterium]